MPLTHDELARAWPDLAIAAVVHDGHAAHEATLRLQPWVLFLDVPLSGTIGLDLARLAGPRARRLITAFDHYAVQAFDEGAVDYLLKPLDAVRLARAAQRLRVALHRHRRWLWLAVALAAVGAAVVYAWMLWRSGLLRWPLRGSD